MVNVFMRSLTEAAVAPTAAAARGYALVSTSDAGGDQHCLYDPTYLALELDAMIVADPSLRKRARALARELVRVPVDVVVAYISTARLYDDDVWNVDLVAAKRGFGPLMYDLAMSDRFVTSSITGNTSPSARRVWRSYYTERPDVERIAFQKDERSVTNEPWLHSAFKLRSAIDVSALRRNHESLLNEIMNLRIDRVVIDDMLVRAGATWGTGEIYA